MRIITKSRHFRQVLLNSRQLTVVIIHVKLTAIIIQICNSYMCQVSMVILACSSAGVFRVFSPASSEFESKMALAWSKCARSLSKMRLHCRLL